MICSIKYYIAPITTKTHITSNHKCSNIPSALRRKIQGTRQAALRLQQQGRHGLLFDHNRRHDG